MVQERAFDIREATKEDLPALLAVQREAFGRVALELSIEPHSLPPLNESVADLEELMATGVGFLIATAEDVIIGGVRVSRSGGRVDFGRLVVSSGWVRRGVASALMDAAELIHSDAERFVLFTGAEALAPLALYEGRGYVRTHVEPTAATTIVWLEKSADRHTR